jgi:hypothetical protein
MKKLCVLCLITLAAVFVDIVFFHARTANAQTPQSTQVHVQPVKQGVHGFSDGVTTVTGTVVGFSCVGSDSHYCYIATVR